MKKRAWKSKIRKACREAGTYMPYFDAAVDTLAGILERRDEVEELYQKSEVGPVVEYTNKNGSTNMVKNPVLATWDDMNKAALTYWRDLGLTPAGLKKIREDSFRKEQEKSAGEDLFQRLQAARAAREEKDGGV